MKEYALFVKPNGVAELFSGGQFELFANGQGMVLNIARLWNMLAERGEVLSEIHETGVDDRSGEQTFVVKTRLKAPPAQETENCREGRCEHPKNFAGSCVVYLMEHPVQCDQHRRW